MQIKPTGRLLVAGALVLAAAAASGCGDLTVQPKSDVTSRNFYNDTSSYKSYLAKLYAGLVTTGQSGPSNDPDIGGIDEGFSQYVRGYWQLQELPTDEAIIGWGDIGLPELNKQTWSANNPFITAMYSRIFYQIALANRFLVVTREDSLKKYNVGEGLAAEVAQYRAEARFLRALSYWHALDLFGNVPLVDENFDIVQLPQQATRAQVFDFVEAELKAVRNDLPTHADVQYGRASQAAADMVLAKLYLNAEVYTGSARWADARVAAEAVIGAGYALDPNYRHMFMADNNTSPELIFTAPQDGVHTRTYGGTTYLVHAGVGGDMPAAAYGVDGGWWGLRLRPETFARFDPADGRASYFWETNQTVDINEISNFYNGIAAPKYSNKTSTGGTGSDLGFPDTDFPMFRLADAYLIYAEAVVRGGGGTMAQAVDYVNALRERAFGDATHDITEAELTLPFILDERSRELLWEGHRRQDLIRFGLFTDAGIWQWKGGVKEGETTPSYRNLYPIPSAELTANPNIHQNPGY
jgi:hypothetical protein